MDDKNNNINLISKRFVLTGIVKLSKRRVSVSLFSKRLSSGYSDSSTIKSPQLKQRISFNSQKLSLNQTEKKNIEDLNKDLNNTNIVKDYSILSTKFLQIKDCSILKYGIKQSTEKIEYSYCKTCDPSLIYPTCMACIKKCHNGHIIKKNSKFGYIKCSCGVKLHKIDNLKQNLNNNSNKKCLCNEWNKIAKLNIFYTTNDKKNICEFCKVICMEKLKIYNNLNNNDFNKNKLNYLNFNIKENCTSNIPECECDSLNIHNNAKTILYGNTFFFCQYNNIYEKILHPLQIINMIFKSHEYFKTNFYDFCEIFNLLKSPGKFKSIPENYRNVEFTKTRIYLSLNFLRQLVQKLSHKKLFYYCSEVENYFNFENLKKLYAKSSYYEKSFLLFMKEYLYLFNKIYINKKTINFYKYNLNDYENFSCIQRIILSKNNQKDFPESEEIITFFLEWLNNIDDISLAYIESLSCVYQIVLIIYKFTTFNLVTNKNIIRFLIKMIKIFDGINYIKNCLIFKDNYIHQNDKKNHNFSTHNSTIGSKINLIIYSQIMDTNIESKELLLNIELKICYITIKIIIYTLYNYNDKIFEHYIFENKINIRKNLNKESNYFLFNEKQLWPLILKVTIIILSFIQNNYENKNKHESKIYKLILRHSMTILEHSLCAQDTYYFNIVKSINDIKINCPDITEYIESEFTSNIINEIIKEKTNISVFYNHFLNFETSRQELISIVNDSLNKVLGDDILPLLNTLYNDNFEPCSFKNEKNIGIIKSAYFFEISKIMEIINLNNEKCTYKENGNSFVIDNNQKRNFEKYENILNNDNLLKISEFMKGNNFKNIIDKIILFYFCFAKKSSSNSLIVLSRYILNQLTKLPNEYGYLVFKLIHSCLQNIVSIDSIIINIKHIIKISYKFLQKLIFSNDEKTPNCVLIFLMILKDLIYKIKMYHSSFIYTIQKYILLLHNDYHLSLKYFELIQKEKTIEKKLNSNKNLVSNKDKNNNKNILKHDFNIYIKLINDIFDFSIYEEREKIKRIININSIIHLLKNHNLNLSIRTEFLKFLRKMLVDLTYTENSKELYTKAIINDEDNIKELTLNPLADNNHYPTKYLRFIEDFYNISAKNILQDKQNFQNNIKQSKIFTKENNDNSYPKISIISNNTSQDEDNLSIKHIFSNQIIPNRSKSQTSNKNNKNLRNKSQYLSPSFFKRNSNFLNRNYNSLKGEIKVCKSNLFPIPEKESIKKLRRYGINKENDSEINSLDNNSELTKVELEIISHNDNQNAQSSEVSSDSYDIKEELLKIEKIHRDSMNDFNTDKESISSNKYSTPSNSGNELLVQKTENNLNLLSCFDDLFYNILKYELENLTGFIENELSSEKKDEKNNKKILHNYLEDGLLIPIIYFFKKSFSLIHNFSGLEIIKLFNLVEQSINLKLFISKLKYSLWEEEDDEENNEKEIELEENNNNILNNNILKNNNKKSLIKGKYFKNKTLIEQTYKSLDAIKSQKISMFDYISLYQIVEKEFFNILKDKRILSFNKIFEPEKNNKLQKEIKQKLDYNLKYNNKNNLDMEEKFYNVYLIYQYNKTFLTDEKNSPFFNLLSEISMTAKTDYKNLLLKSLIFCWRNESNNKEYRYKSFYLLYKLLSIKTPEIQLNIINLIKDENDNFIHDASNYLLEKIILLIIEYLNPVNEGKISHYLPAYTSIKFFKVLCQDNNHFFKHYLLKEISYKYIHEIPFYYKTLRGTTEIISSFKNKKLFTREVTNDKNSMYNCFVIQSINYIYHCVNFFDFFLLFLIKIIIISNWDELNKDCIHQNSFLYKLFNIILELLNELIRNNNHNFVFENEKIKESNKKYPVLNHQVRNTKSKIKDEKTALRIFVEYVCKILATNRINLEIFYKIKINIMELILSLIEEKNSNKSIKKNIPKYLNVNQVIRIIIRILKSYYVNNTINSNLTLKYENKNNDNNIKYIVNSNDIKDTSKYFRNNKLNATINDNTMNVVPSSTISPFISSKKNLLSVINYKLNKNSENIQQNTISSSSNIKFNNSNSQFFKFNKIFKKNQENLSKLSEMKKLTKKAISSKQLYLKGNYINKLNSLKLTPLKAIKKDLKWDFLEKINKKSNVLRKNPKIIFDSKLCNYFMNEFNSKKEFRKTNEFILSNMMYKYLKNIIIFNDNKMMKQFIDKVNSTKEQLSNKKRLKKNMIISKIIEFFYNKIFKQNNSNEINKNFDDKEFIEKFYMIKFFENITGSIEVHLADHSRQIIFFTKIPEMIYLSKTTKKNFEHNVKRKSETNIKKDLMNNIKFFIEEIKYFEKHNHFNNFLRKFNFKFLNIISYIYAVGLNIVLFSVVKGDKFLSEHNSNEFRRKDKYYLNKSIDLSLNKWKNTLYFFCYFYILLNGIILTIWIYFRLPFLYKLDKIKFKEIYQFKNKIQLSDKLFIIIFMTISKRDQILIIIYEFFLVTISLFMERGEMLYSLFLLPIIKLNSTLKLVIKSIQLRYKEFFLVFFLSAIVIYTLTNIAFFFFNSDFEEELDYFNDNYCKSLISCVLNSLDNGLRARGGIGDSGKKISFLRNYKHYIGRLILDIIFFFLIVIILTDMVFGIIVESFSSLRNKEHLYLKDKYNRCFICNGKKPILEKHGTNFQDHVKYIHNLWNYVEYIITIKESNIQELNSVSQYIRKKIENNDISWLPTNVDLFKKKEDYGNDEIIILEEKIHEYKIKKNDLEISANPTKLINNTEK